MQNRHHMHQIFRSAATIVLICIALISSGGSARAQRGEKKVPCQTYQECYENAVLAYIYAYPLMMVEVTKRVATNVPDAVSATGRAPINQFSNNSIPTAEYKDIVLPSVSTPYSNAFLDLRKEPIVLHLPDLGDRFYLMQVLDAWTNVGGKNVECLYGKDGFCGLGSRYHTTEGNYAFVGPNWNKPLPPEIDQVIRRSTNTGWIAGRTLTTGSQQDLDTVAAIQAQYTLTPLQYFGKPYTPPSGLPVNPHIDMQTPPKTQVANMSAGKYFKMFARLLRANPPLAQDAEMVARLATIGIVPGERFNLKRINRMARVALQDAVPTAQNLIIKETQLGSLTTTNWSMNTKLGVYGRRYLLRASIAYGGLGANLYKDAVYAGVYLDSTGTNLNGANNQNYTLTFAANSLPPANSAAFWSVTLYNRPEENLYENTLGRNALGIPSAQDHLPCPNSDGSYTFYIRNVSPDPNTEPLEYCNWLPAPADEFILLLRIYWPGRSLLDGDWIPPAVKAD